MNHSDSERIASILEAVKYEKVLFEDKADLIVINMCSVRKSAVDRVAGNFKRYKKYKKKNPNLKIVLTGCVVESDRERFEKLFDLVIDIKEIEQLSDRLFNGQADLPDKQAQSDYNNYFNIKPNYQNNFSAYVPIMTGCNNFCSYCVVPYTRGREYSRPVKEVLNEVTELVENGYKEIILLGQNVNSYESQTTNKFKISSQRLVFSQGGQQRLGRKNPKHIPCFVSRIPNSKTINFPILLNLINDIPGNFWIRFLTSHPKDITEDLIRSVAECEKVTPYIHLALQSGDDEILKKMNRKYTSEHFLNLVKIIRKYIPNVAITTDVIIGFPAETEKQFQKTAEVMKKAKFDMVYINKYSPRVGTVSAKLEDSVNWKEKKRRENILTEILKETALENNQKYIGKTVNILIDKLGENLICGKTESFKNVRVKLKVTNYRSKIKKGEFTEVKIVEADAWGLKGKIDK